MSVDLPLNFVTIGSCASIFPHYNLPMLDVNKIRTDFPILQEEAYPGVPLIYLDSAASSQKPLPVIEVMDHYYRHTNANVHRGIHRLSEEATNAYEGARERIARFINAADSAEVIYVRNATEAFNLVGVPIENPSRSR